MTVLGKQTLLNREFSDFLSTLLPSRHFLDFNPWFQITLRGAFRINQANYCIMLLTTTWAACTTICWTHLLLHKVVGPLCSVLSRSLNIIENSTNRIILEIWLLWSLLLLQLHFSDIGWARFWCIRRWMSLESILNYYWWIIYLISFPVWSPLRCTLYWEFPSNFEGRTCAIFQLQLLLLVLLDIELFDSWLILSCHRLMRPVSWWLSLFPQSIPVCWSLKLQPHLRCFALWRTSYLGVSDIINAIIILR
jgi:hypothetical protein